jgi:GNAT superfamily N-acetyltransferase
MDFKGYAPTLPSQTLTLFCYHVGQRDDTSARDARYFGRGIGLRLLEETLKWATSAGFEAVVAKGCPRFRPVIEYMGGMPTEVYKAKDFEVVASYHDPDLRALIEDMLRSNALEGVDLDEAAEVSVCVRMLPLSQ